MFDAVLQVTAGPILELNKQTLDNSPSILRTREHANDIQRRIYVVKSHATVTGYWGRNYSRPGFVAANTQPRWYRLFTLSSNPSQDCSSSVARKPNSGAAETKWVDPNSGAALDRFILSGVAILNGMRTKSHGSSKLSRGQAYRLTYNLHPCLTRDSNPEPPAPQFGGAPTDCATGDREINVIQNVHSDKISPSRTTQFGVWVIGAQNYLFPKYADAAELCGRGFKRDFRSTVIAAFVRERGLPVLAQSLAAKSARRELQEYQLADWVAAALYTRLACSPPTKAIRFQSPAGSFRVFACGNRARRCRWSAGFLWDIPIPPPFIPAFGDEHCVFAIVGRACRTISFCKVAHPVSRAARHDENRNNFQSKTPCRAAEFVGLTGAAGRLGGFGSFRTSSAIFGSTRVVLGSCRLNIVESTRRCSAVTPTNSSSMELPLDCLSPDGIRNTKTTLRRHIPPTFVQQALTSTRVGNGFPSHAARRQECYSYEQMKLRCSLQHAAEIGDKSTNDLSESDQHTCVSDGCLYVHRCSLVSGRSTFSFSRLHSGYWFLLLVPSVYSTMGVDKGVQGATAPSPHPSSTNKVVTYSAPTDTAPRLVSIRPPPVSLPPLEQTRDRDSNESTRATRRRRAQTQLTSLSAGPPLHPTVEWPRPRTRRPPAPAYL
ncbi:hypothetical protein PR048_019101 [Dryococelus australis]|uniref:Uncharacterized protein n=1 Tax=Dryococelus australis TaxID=614101 RepID=A0ABQ9H2L7_9NEOP|nr:hypothetical protein PR048_019101 [Dryococelus australis]